jgi:hypothetical protein
MASSFLRPHHLLLSTYSKWVSFMAYQLSQMPGGFSTSYCCIWAFDAVISLYAMIISLLLSVYWRTRFLFVTSLPAVKFAPDWLVTMNSGQRFSIPGLLRMIYYASPHDIKASSIVLSYCDFASLRNYSMFSFWNGWCRYFIRPLHLLLKTLNERFHAHYFSHFITKATRLSIRLIIIDLWRN